MLAMLALGTIRIAVISQTTTAMVKMIMIEMIILVTVMISTAMMSPTMMVKMLGKMSVVIRTSQ